MEQAITISDGRAAQGPKKINNKNKESVRNFFINNPGASKAECSRATGLTWQTVKKHTDSILADQENNNG